MKGTILSNRYLLDDEIGTGGMGNVYRATDLRTGGNVAVKIPHAFLAKNPEYVERLRREAQIAASLSSARVVRVIDLHEHEGLPYLVMEYVPGDTLGDRIKMQGRFTLAETLTVGLEVARALEAAHLRGIVHRDLKPHNIKLVDDEVKVLDFGIAKAEGFAGMTAASIFMGTPEYSAPERAEGLGDIRSDMYSLAVIMFEMIEGYLPFQGLTPLAVMRKHETETPPPLSGDVPPLTRAIIVKCLAKSPEDRYETPRELVQDLMLALRELPEHTGAATPLASPRLTPPAPTLIQAAAPPHREETATASAPDAPVADRPASGAASVPHSPVSSGPVDRAPVGIGPQSGPSHAAVSDSRSGAQPLAPSFAATGELVARGVTDVPPTTGATQLPGSRRPLWPWLATGAGALLTSIGLVAANRGGDGVPSVPTTDPATATVVIAVVPPRTPTPLPTPPATPAPAPTPTPETGPPNGIALATLSPEEREVARAVNNANIALIDRVLRRVDPAPLAQFYTGEALAEYETFVAELRKLNRYAQSELRETKLEFVRFPNPTTAEVRTRERWSYDEFTSGTNERVTGAGYDAEKNDTYTLLKRDGRWLVDKLAQTYISQTLR